MLIDNFEFPDNWSVRGNRSDWSVWCDNLIQFSGHRDATIFKIYWDRDGDELYTDEMFDLELGLIDACQNGMSTDTWDLWRRDCHPQTWRLLGATGALFHFIAHSVGGMVTVPGAGWPTRQEVLDGIDCATEHLPGPGRWRWAVGIQ